MVELYWIIINITGFLMMGIDKWKAKNRQWRIPEKTLFAISIAGGSVGVWLGMQFFRHKTRHVSFVVGIPLIFIVQLILAVVL